jgi:hypothetical protein
MQNSLVVKKHVQEIINLVHRYQHFGGDLTSQPVLCGS